MQRLGPYALEEELGRGGMGVVYRARHLELGRTVALKLLLEVGEAELQRFQREALALARLKHPNVVTIHEAGQHEGKPWLAMERVEGESLEAQLQRDGPLDPRRAAEAVRQAALGVAAAHAAGILHRDLKPDNILCSTDGRVQVTDFGLALPEGSQRDRLTQTGVVVGSPSYMPPEQAWAKAKLVGPGADVYGLGATLYALLTGQPPFRAPTIMVLLAAIAYQPPRPPRELRPDVPGDLEAVCLRCLEKDPADRYANCAELVTDLERFARGEPVLASPPGWAGRVRRWGRRHRKLVSLIAALALLAVFLGAAIPAYHREQARQAADERTASLRRSEAKLAAARQRQLERERRSEERAQARASEARARRLEAAKRVLERARAQRSTDGTHTQEGALRIIAILEPMWEELKDLPADDPARTLIGKELAQALFDNPKRARLAGAENAIYMDRILAIDPDHLRALEDRARHPFDPGGDAIRAHRRSLADIERLLTLDGRTPRRLAAKARLLSVLGRHGEAMVTAREATASLDDQASIIVQREAWEARGLVALRSGRPIAARDSFDRALTIQAFPPTFIFRAQALERLGLYDAAREDLHRALAMDRLAESDHGTCIVLLELAFFEARRGRLDACAAALDDEALEKWPMHHERLLLLARVRLHQNDLVGARKALRRAARQFREAGNPLPPELRALVRAVREQESR